MRNIFILSKNYFLCALGSLRGKRASAKGMAGIGLIVLLFGGLFALMLFSAMVQAEQYVKIGLEKMVLFSGFFMGLFITLVFAVQKVTGGQRANDAEMLFAMPFTKMQIVIAKAVSRYMFNLGALCVFALPNIIAYLWFAPFSFPAILGCLLIMLIIPFFMVGLSYLIDFLTTVLFPSSTTGNVIKALFCIALVIGFLILYQFVTPVITENTKTVDDYMNQLPPVAMLVNAAVDFNLLFILIAFGVSALSFIGGTALFATSLNRYNQGAKSKAVDFGSTKSATTFGVIFKNDLKRYFNSTIYMVNTLIGPISVIGLTIWLAIDESSFLSFFTQMGLGADVLPFAIAIIFSFMAGMTYASASAISLEGKNFWLLKTMPINVNEVLFAKTVLNLLLFTPISVLCSFVLWFVLQLSVMDFLLILTLPVIVNVLISFMGTFINLLYPKFEFESEASVVKQSMAVMIMTFSGMFISIAPMLIAFIFGGIGMWTIITSYALFLALTVTFVTLVFTVGTRIFKKL